MAVMSVATTDLAAAMVVLDAMVKEETEMEEATRVVKIVTLRHQHEQR